MASLSSVANIAQALSGLALVSPQKTIGYQPQLAPSVLQNTYPYSSQQQSAALMFHYEGENSVQLKSDITDHYIESNSSIADNIALPPERITVRGFVGELNNVLPPSVAVLSTLRNNLIAISGYEPTLTAQALLAYNTAFFLYQVAQSAASTTIQALASLNGSGGENVINGNGLSAFNATNGKISNNQNAQQTMFQQFYGYWRNKSLFTIQTPWAVFQDCAIEGLRSIQDEDTQEISSFEVTFKVLRFAEAIVTNNAPSIQTDFNNAAGRLQNQAQPPVNLGSQTLTPSATSFSSLTSAVA